MKIIPFDKREGFIWYNGNIILWQDAKIHMMTHGLHYASCVFEGERAYNGRVFKSREHSERLHNSAKLLDFIIPYSVDELLLAKEQLLKAQGVTDGYVRPFAWRGSEKMTIAARHNSIHTAIACWSWPNYYPSKDQGITMMISEWIKPHPASVPFASKASGLYVTCTLSKNKAEEMGFDDALFLDYRGFIAEGSSSNIFLVFNGELHTPIADCFLNGITRQTIIELAKERGITVVERYIKPEELSEANEVFLTGTAAEITPVKAIASHNYQIGHITKLMTESYQRLTRQG